MAMSKELNSARGLFPGVPGPSSTHTNTRTDEWLLTRVASRVHPDPWKLKHFALLLGIDDDTYCKIQQEAKATGQGIPLHILNHWTKEHPSFNELLTLLPKAEELDLVEKKTIIGILEEEERQASLRTLNDTTVDKELKDRINHALRIKYQHPKWQSLLLYPWVKDMAFQLSEVYSTLEMEYAMSRRTLRDYPELFQDHGSRILVLGKPGIGKTTFTHKIGLDWARREFDKFESVFVIKLRDLHPDQSICNAIALQYEDYLLPHESLHNYLMKSKDSVLLILDGLDDIELKKYPQLNRILCGIDYPSCCVMITSRSHVAIDIKEEMSCIANIIGFSKESAEKYIYHFIPDPAARREFFKLLVAKKMYEMYKVPIILQALALLFDHCKRKLPETYTATFNQLVELISLKKIRDGNTRLSEEDIEAAIEETNKLAFQCLMKDQFVFLSISIINQNVLKLGLVSITRMQTQYGRQALVEFPHKTIMEYAAGGHVATEYIQGRTEAWEKVKEAFTKLFMSKQKNNYSSKREMNRSFHTVEEQRNIITGTKKFVEAIMDDPGGKVVAIKRLTKVFLDKGFYDENPDISTLREAAKNFRESKMMNDDEFNAVFEFGIELLSLADPEQKKKMRRRAVKLYNSNFDARKLAMALYLMINWMDTNPDEAMEVISSTLQSLIFSSAMVSSKTVTEQVQWLQDQANSTKILFRFILGKLTRYPKLAEQILKEIAELLIEHAFDSSSGEVLSIHFIQQYILDLMSEAGFSHQFPNSALYSSEMELPDDFLNAPLVVHLEYTDARLPDMSEVTALSAVKIVNSFGLGMENMPGLRVLELHDIEDEALVRDDSERFTQALSSTSLLSLVIDNIEDITLCTSLLRNLPPSLLRLTILHSNLGKRYQLPIHMNLQSLHVEEGPGVSGIFSSTYFPHLQRITVTGIKWKQLDIRSLVAAAREIRLPSLKHLCIRFGNLSKRGGEIMKITQTCELQSLDLMDTNLTKKDGRILLTHLETGNLLSIQSLNLLHNRGLNSLVPRFQAVATDQQIDIQCAVNTDKPKPGKSVQLLNLLVCRFQTMTLGSQDSVATDQQIDIQYTGKTDKTPSGKSVQPTTSQSVLLQNQDSVATDQQIHIHFTEETDKTPSCKSVQPSTSQSVLLQNQDSATTDQHIEIKNREKTDKTRSGKSVKPKSVLLPSPVQPRSIRSVLLQRQDSVATDQQIDIQFTEKTDKTPSGKSVQPSTSQSVLLQNQDQIFFSNGDELQKQSLRIPSLLNMSQDILMKRYHFVRCIQGFPCIIEGSQSDILLHVPEGVYGIALAKIHTNHAKFLKYIPSRDCVVCPIFECHLIPLYGKELAHDSQYKLQIPHIIRNIQKVKGQIRVRFVDHEGVTSLVKPDSYEIDEKYVSVYTSHFCACIITVENINCCGANVNVLIFGSLSAGQEDVKPVATVKVFMCGTHMENKDYLENLKQQEADMAMSLTLLTKTSIALGGQPYDTVKSKVRLQLKARDEEKWKPLTKKPLTLEKSLNLALMYRSDGHLCKQDPLKVALFYMESSRMTNIFSGILETEMHIVKHLPSQSPENPHENLSNGCSQCKLPSVDQNVFDFMGSFRKGINYMWLALPSWGWLPFLRQVQDPPLNRVQVIYEETLVNIECHENQKSGTHPSHTVAKAGVALETRDLSRLASGISIHDMQRIAHEHLNFDMPEVQNLQAECNNPHMFNLAILRKWCNKSSENSHSELAKNLFKAAEKSLIDPFMVEEILGERRP